MGTPRQPQSFAQPKPVDASLRASSNLREVQPTLFPFSDYTVDAREGLHIATLEEGNRIRRNRQRPHRHDFYQIFWITHGERSFSIDFDSFPVSAPSFVFVPPGAVHTFGTLESTSGYALSFQQDFLEAQGHSVDLFQDCPAFDPAHFQAVLRVTPAIEERATRCVEQIFAEFSSKQLGYRAAMAALLRLLFIEIRRVLSNQAGSNSFQKYSSLTARFLRRLNSRPYQMASASEVSRFLGVSRSWLNQLVRKETGKNLTDHLQGRLILESKRLLAHTDLNISEIAYQLGFEDASYFTRLFRQIAQTSPSEFRELHR
jgi:AraC family transcriptional regulator, transcriptional activator of pobA